MPNRSSPAASLCPPRETKSSVAGGDTTTGSSGATWRAAVRTGTPPTSTRPAPIASTARVRLGTSPRRTSSRSSRLRTRRSVRRRRGRGVLLRRRLLRGSLLAGRLLGRPLLALRLLPDLLHELALQGRKIRLRRETERAQLPLDLLANDRTKRVAAPAAGFDDLVDRRADLIASELSLGDEVGCELARL